MTITSTKPLKKKKEKSRLPHNRPTLPSASSKTNPGKVKVKLVDLRPMKKFLQSRMPDSPLAEALSRENDEIPISQFLQLFPLFLQIGELKKIK